MQLGDVLRDNTRSYDIVSRNGGEEFSVLLLDASLENSVKVAEKLRSAIDNELFELSGGMEIHITVSVGIANYPETTKDPEKLLDDADRALYKAKRSGRNTVKRV